MARRQVPGRRPIVVLPHPDSPTSPNVSPCRISRLTPATALTESAFRCSTPLVTVRSGPVISEPGDAPVSAASAISWRRAHDEQRGGVIVQMAADVA